MRLILTETGLEMMFKAVEGVEEAATERLGRFAPKLGEDKFNWIKDLLRDDIRARLAYRLIVRATTEYLNLDPVAVKEMMEIEGEVAGRAFDEAFWNGDLSRLLHDPEGEARVSRAMDAYIAAKNPGPPPYEHIGVDAFSEAVINFIDNYTRRQKWPQSGASDDTGHRSPRP